MIVCGVIKNVIVKIIGIIFVGFIFNGRCVDWFLLVGEWFVFLVYWIVIFCMVCWMKIILIIIVKIVIIRSVIFIIWINNWLLLLINWVLYICLIVLGILVIIFVKIMIDILLFILWDVICFLSYIKKVVLLVSIKVMMRYVDILDFLISILFVRLLNL